MAFATWGDIVLNILVDTLKPTRAVATISEIPLLKKPSDLTTCTTVVQQGGRLRKRISWDGTVADIDEYDALEADWHNATVRVFACAKVGSSLSCYIEDLSEPEYIQEGIIKYSIVLMEA